MGAPGHRLVVIGASAGGVEALTGLVRDLPADLPASVVVVLHVPPWGTSVLPEILSRNSLLPATSAKQGDPLLQGHIYVAPPDQHVRVHDGMLVLDRGPKLAGHRPAIDPLFCSAAGPGVIGVILSGTLQDGSAGLGEIKQRGGLAIVQDPADALYPGMPTNAIERVAVDHIVPLSAMGVLIAELTKAPTVKR